MTEIKEEIEDSVVLDSARLLKIDLGKDTDEVYKFLGAVSVELNEVPVKDPRYYISKLTEVRRKITDVNKQYTDLLQAKTRAQSRLTTKETKYEIQMNSRLGEDTAVKAGQSIDDRRARAANTLVSIKHQIRECKNEVEAIKNLDKALNMILKNLNALSNDLKQQARLVELDLQHFKGSTLQDGEESVDAFANEMKALEEKFQVESVTSSDEDEETLATDEDEETAEEESAEEELVELQASEAAELPATEALEAPIEEVTTTELPSLETPSESLSVPEESVMELPAEEDPPMFSLPEEAEEVSMELPAEEEPPMFSLPEDVTEEATLETPSVLSSESTDEDEETSEDQDPLIFNSSDSTDLSNIPDMPEPDLSGLGDGLVPEPNLGLSIGEISSETTSIVIPESSSIASEDFSVLSVSVTAPKVSKHFADSIKESPALPKEVPVAKSVKVEKPAETKKEVPKAAPAPATVDDVLAELGI